MLSLRHTLSPSKVTAPVEGDKKPAIMWISVDLPAPLGPKSPVTPGPIRMVTSLTATTFPNHRETCSRLDGAHAPATFRYRMSRAA